MNQKSRFPAVRAYRWLETHQDHGNPGFDYLWRLYKGRAEKKLSKMTFAPRFPTAKIPKKASTTSRKKDFRAECEALCKAIVRKRDLECDSFMMSWGNCISCGVGPSSNFNLQWGHFIAQNDSKWLQYDTRNTGMQCVRCNGFMQGNYRQYREAINRREPGLADKLEAEVVKYRTWKQGIAELMGKRAELIRECELAGIDPETVLRK